MTCYRKFTRDFPITWPLFYMVRGAKVHEGRAFSPALDSEFSVEKMKCRSSFRGTFSFENDRGIGVSKNKEINKKQFNAIFKFLSNLHIVSRDFLSTSTSTNEILRSVSDVQTIGWA